MKYLNSFLLLALLAVLFSCGEEDSDDIMSSDTIIGEWQLVALDYMGSSTTINPYGPPVSSVFEGVARDVNTTITFNADNTFVSLGSYIIDLEADVLGYTIEQAFPFEGFLGSGTWELDGTTMTTTNDTNQQTSVIELENFSDNSWNTNYRTELSTIQQGFTVNQVIDGNFFFEK